MRLWPALDTRISIMKVCNYYYDIGQVSLSNLFLEAHIRMTDFDDETEVEERRHKQT